MSRLRWTTVAVKPPGDTAVRLTFAGTAAVECDGLTSCLTDPAGSSAHSPPSALPGPPHGHSQPVAVVYIADAGEVRADMQFADRVGHLHGVRDSGSPLERARQLAGHSGPVQLPVI